MSMTLRAPDGPRPPLAPAALIRRIEAAVASDRTTVLAATLARLAREGALDCPEFYCPALSERYSRKLVWRDRGARFIVVGMSWNPGQTGPLHDHGGLWGAEIVVAGTMDEATFRMVERDGAGRYRFSRMQHRAMTAGTVGTVSPPLEYHTFGNAGDTVARTFHVYAGDLLRAQTFTSVNGTWYGARQNELRYD